MASAPVVGLTGGIGSGKSTVARMLAELGATVVDADKIGHEVYRPGAEAYASVVDAFGRGIVAPDGTVDRRALGAIVFADPAALARLNALVHPAIGREIQRRITAARDAGGAPIVVEAAIMIEAGWRFFDRIWAVIAPREAAIARVVAERGLSAEDVERRMGAQLSDAERRRVADLVIENDGTREELRARVEAAWRTLRG
jgi:dephospho-CoA kinase